MWDENEKMDVVVDSNEVAQNELEKKNVGAVISQEPKKLAIERYLLL